MLPTARTHDDHLVEAGHLSVPIVKEHEVGKLQVIGTGFYVTRYGLFMTAGHVFDDFESGFVLHLAGDNEIHLRRISSYSRHTKLDVAVGQAYTWEDRYPHNPLQNLKGSLDLRKPGVGSPVRTYAYPENAIWEFAPDQKSKITHELRGNYFPGTVLEHLDSGPFMPYPHYSTSMEVRGGASGGPVYNDEGFVIGVNCRGWDFGGGEFEGDHLSSVVPIRAALEITNVSLAAVPKVSLEYKRLPRTARDGNVSFQDLIRLGHISCRNRVIDGTTVRPIGED